MHSPLSTPIFLFCLRLFLLVLFAFGPVLLYFSHRENSCETVLELLAFSNKKESQKDSFSHSLKMRISEVSEQPKSFRCSLASRLCHSKGPVSLEDTNLS